MTVLAPFGSAVHLYAAVIRVEWDLLERGWYWPPAEDAWTFLREHVQELADVDRLLMRLPALVHAALSGEAGWSLTSGVDNRSATLYLLAEHATTSETVDEVLARLQRVPLDARPDLTERGIA